MNKKKEIWLMVSLFLAIAFSFSISYAEEQTANETETIHFALSNARAEIDDGQMQSFYSNINISSWQSLHEFQIDFSNAEGVSNLSVYVQGNYCDSNKVGTITHGTYICTSQLLSNLSNALLNVTIKNEGQLDSGNPNVTVNILDGRFTVDRGVTFNVTSISQAQLDALQNNINANTNSTMQTILNKIDTAGSIVWNFVLSFFGGRTANEVLRDIDANITHINGTVSNGTVSASDVWSFPLGKHGETAGHELNETFKWRGE